MGPAGKAAYRQHWAEAQASSHFSLPPAWHCSLVGGAPGRVWRYRSVPSGAECTRHRSSAGGFAFRWRVMLLVEPDSAELHRVRQNVLAMGSEHRSVFAFRSRLPGTWLTGWACQARQYGQSSAAADRAQDLSAEGAGRSEQAAELSRRENSSPFGLFQAHKPGQAHILGSGRLCPSGSF